MSIGEPTFYVQISHPFSFNEWYKYIMKYLFSQSHSRPLLRCPHIPQTAGIGNPIPFSWPVPGPISRTSSLRRLSIIIISSIFWVKKHNKVLFLFLWTHRFFLRVIDIPAKCVLYFSTTYRNSVYLLLNRLRGCKPSPLSLMENHGMSGARQISFEDAPFSAIHKKITAGTFMGQISDGYTLGIVGISLNYAMEPLGLTSFWMGLIGAGSMFGIFFGSLLAGITADKIGRRPLYASLMLLTAISSVLHSSFPIRCSSP